MAREQQRPSLGQVVRKHRIDAGLTQQELARRAGLSVRALRDLEQDRVTQPRAPSIRRLQAALGLSDGQRAELLASVPLPSGSGVPVRVGVLGPLSVHRDGVEVEVAARLPRALLGLLALQPGQLVTRDQIIDVLWGERPPRTCLSLVHGYAGQVRALLEPGRVGGSASRTLVWARSGYRLLLEPDQVDLTSFDDLAGAADRARRDGDRELAYRLYGQALACWRGPVLADAPDRLRQHPTAMAATRNRVTAALAYADLALDLGRHDQAVTQLRPLLDTEPLHEGLHARLILALAGGGEQAAALRLFTEFRARLADELGVEPGTEVHAAYLRVLRRPDIATGIGSTHGPAPAQLPPDVAGFTGRETYLRRLDALLDADRGDTAGLVICAVAGTAGVGKTALAVHWAHGVRQRFPDGQLYLNLRGYAPVPPLAASDALARFLTALGVPADRVPQDVDQAAALYRSLLADRRVLVLLDNARTADQVRPLLPASPGCLVLVTSRDQLGGLVARDGARRVNVEVLAPQEARALLQTVLGADRVAAESEATTDLAGLCAYLPLALRIAAANLTGNPRHRVADYADRLRTGDRLTALRIDGDPDTAVRATFSCSYQALSAPAARLFRLLGLPPGPDITVPATASLAAIPYAEARTLLAELTAAHLITEHTPGRYTFHDLLRAYAAEQADRVEPDSGRQTALHRLFDHYLHTAYQANQLLDPDRDDITLAALQPGVVPEQHADAHHALAWVSAEYHTLREVVAHTAHTGFLTHTWQLAWSMTAFLMLRARWQDRATIQTLALDAANRCGDQAGQAQAHRSLGYANVHLRHYHDAHTHLRQALGQFELLGDRHNQALTHLGLAWLFGAQHRDREALDHAQRSLALFQATGHRIGQARAVNAVGSCHAQLGNHHQTLAHCQGALTLLQGQHNRRAEADIWENLGYSHHHLGDYPHAVDSYRRALKLTQELDDRYGQAIILTQLGDSHQAAGDPPAARTAWQQALSILDQLNHPDADQVRNKLT
jgi:DNA-binding SARP family transcriptional activator